MANSIRYEGQPGGFSTSSVFAIQQPRSLDPRSSASIREVTTPLADAIEYLRSILWGLAPNTYLGPVMTWGSGVGKVRLYAAGAAALARGLVVTVNASWDSGGSEWARDDAGASRFYLFGGDGLRLYSRAAGDASPWVDGGWALLNYSNAAGDWISEGDVDSNAGRVMAASYLAAGGAAGGAATIGDPAPWTPAVPHGSIYADSAPIAWARIASNGSLLAGVNIHEVIRVAAGHYRIVTGNTTATIGAVLVQPVGSTGLPGTSDLGITAQTISVGGRLTGEVWVRDRDYTAAPPTSTDTDAPLMVAIFGML